jgi:predicted alpha/beta superfamily hydrolase
MRNILILVFLIIISWGCKQEVKDQSNTINIGVKDNVFSKVLNEDRPIWVYLPSASDDQAAYAKKKYPVIYLLDGDGHFHGLVGMVRHFRSIIPEVIIVGIPNTVRTRDLTHTHVDVVFGDSTFSKTSGGGEKFTEFIEKELIPFVDSKYPTTTHRTLIGHSLGGLFAINTLIKHNDLFNNYLAIDPSLWWDNRVTLDLAKEKWNNIDFKNRWLYVAVANTMDAGMKIESIESDTAESSEHIRSILEFNHFMDENKKELNFKSNYYPEDDHGTVPFIAEYDALRFMFSWYKMPSIDEFFMPDSKISVDEALNTVTNHFKNVSEILGYGILPDEVMVNSMGYGFMGNNKPEHAYAFFKLNVDNYPQSSNVFDSMGDYYLNQKDTSNAISSFSKALEIAPAPHTKTKLEALQEAVKK